MSQRYICYNINELARLAAEAVGAKSCVEIEKYPDGMHNKALLLTMKDGTQAVAKIPNSNAGRSHYTTASEVATMDFVGLLAIFYKQSVLTLLRLGAFSEVLFRRSTRGVPEPRIIR